MGVRSVGVRRVGVRSVGVRAVAVRVVGVRAVDVAVAAVVTVGRVRAQIPKGAGATIIALHIPTVKTRIGACWGWLVAVEEVEPELSALMVHALLHPNGWRVQVVRHRFRLRRQPQRRHLFE